MPEEKIQARDNRFQPWTACLSKPVKEHQDHRIEPGLGFGYHVRSAAARAYLPHVDPGSLQQKVHRLGTEQEHGKPADFECAQQGIERSMDRNPRPASFIIRIRGSSMHRGIMLIVSRSTTSRSAWPGRLYDNAFAESNTWHFTQQVYNKKRLHSALGCRSPERFEMGVALKCVA